VAVRRVSVSNTKYGEERRGRRDAISNSFDFLCLLQSLMINTGKSGVGDVMPLATPFSARSHGRLASKTSKSEASLTTGGAGHSSLASLQGETDQSLAARSYFDPVTVVMKELRVRAEEKERRKISRQKRKDEIFASVS
jgi:hypothetical protein